MRLRWSYAAFFALAAVAGCYSDHRVGDNSLTAVDGSAPTTGIDSLLLETQGMTFPVCTPKGGGFGSGATCGSAATGSGPMFDSFDCPNNDETTLPRYVLGVFFRNFNPSGVTADTTFDLSDPGHEQYVTVMLDVEKGSGQDYDYCTAPASDADGGASSAASGTVIVHRFVPAAGAPTGDYSSDVEVVNAVIPPLNGGPAYRVVSAHLYF